MLISFSEILVMHEVDQLTVTIFFSCGPYFLLQNMSVWCSCAPLLNPPLMVWIVFFHCKINQFFFIFHLINQYFCHQEKELAPKQEKFDRAKLEDLLKRRFFFVPAFEIYGGWLSNQ